MSDTHVPAAAAAPDLISRIEQSRLEGRLAVEKMREHQARISAELADVLPQSVTAEFHLASNGIVERVTFDREADATYGAAVRALNDAAARVSVAAMRMNPDDADAVIAQIARGEVPEPVSATNDLSQVTAFARNGAIIRIDADEHWIAATSDEDVAAAVSEVSRRAALKSDTTGRDTDESGGF